MKPQDSHKQKDKHILDNRLNTVVDYLRGTSAHRRDISSGIGVFHHLRLRSPPKRVARCKGRTLSSLVIRHRLAK